MGYIIFAFAWILLTAAVWAISRMLKKSPDSDSRKQGVLLGWATGAMLFILLIVTGTNSVVQVPTKNVAVVTYFGKPHGSIGNGLTLIAPWAKTTNLNAAIQTDDYTGDGKGTGAEGPAMEIRIYGGAKAYISTTTRWQMAEGQADELFADYGDFDNIRRSLVTRNLGVVLSEVYSGYNPMQLVGADALLASTGQPATVKITEEKKLAATAQQMLKQKLAGKIDIHDMSIMTPRPDDQTQGAIDGFSAEVAKTASAKQRVLTAGQEAKANEILAASLTNPSVAQVFCLQMTERLISNGKSFSAAWNCGPGAPPVVVPVK